MLIEGRKPELWEEWMRRSRECLERRMVEEEAQAARMRSLIADAVSRGESDEQIQSRLELTFFEYGRHLGMLAEYLGVTTREELYARLLANPSELLP